MRNGLEASSAAHPFGIAGLAPLDISRTRGVVRVQVEMGVAVRMARLEILTRDLGNGPPVP